MSEQALDRFWEACGAAPPFELAIECRATKATLRKKLFQPFAVIGRDPNADVVIDHSSCRRRALYVQMLGGRLLWVDLAGGANDDRSGWLGPGQVLTRSSLIIQRVDSHLTNPSGWPDGFHPLTDRPDDTESLPSVGLQFLRGPEQPVIWRMNRLLTLVGRSELCKVRLLDDRNSRIHCSLLRAPQGLWIVDVLGRGGLRVNGQHVRWAHLDDGDVFEIGRYVIRVTVETALPPAVTPGLPAVVSTSLVPSPGSLVDPGLGTRNPELAAPDALLLPFFHQFSQMQQQMFDQFQQMVLMMAQMFTSMQKEQMGLVREELDRIRELTNELQDLKAQLAAPTPKADNDPLLSVVSDTLSTIDASPTRPHEEFVTSDQPCANGDHEAVTQDPSPTAPESPTQPTSPPPESQAIPKEAGAIPVDMHVWVQHRIAEIQKERDGRLQRIWKLITGR